ncbi:HesA/MoeB/ThiF family protein [Paenibacillus sp. SAF-068]|uniref:HesA/MoeB/ThiF family protein n=1 Tax=Paenibacillus sp. SAF-068 TaxID=3436864 RepID=UPI00241F83F6|nr:HesA/MoeB/ThiF family protein [Paenibacillus amylolyticus]WFR64116.1 HesA/MoeB/ThiF family protein [Paenibacillus amylolyticus]
MTTINSLTEEEKLRYRRQLILPEIGEEGQKILKQSKVLVIGAGGIGSPLLLYLAAAGIGHIKVYDNDNVELTNLNRQVLHGYTNINQNKAESAKQTLSELNPNISIDISRDRLVRENALHIVSEFDIVVNAVDNLETRYMLNDICVEHGTPLIEGSIFHFEGQIMLIEPGKGPCYRCLYPESPVDVKKQEFGVIGMTPGLVGVLQATETIKYLLKIGEPLTNKLIYFDLLSTTIRKIDIKKNPDCPICSHK